MSLGEGLPARSIRLPPCGLQCRSERRVRIDIQKGVALIGLRGKNA